MIRLILLLIVASVALFAYSDRDLDGVEDRNDRCPNTYLTDLVDKHGCTVKSLAKTDSFTISLGTSIGKTDETNETTVTNSLGLYYSNRDFSALISTSVYNYENSTESNSGLNDTTVGVYYRFYPTQIISTQIGGGLILPTFDSSLNNNQTDYFLSSNLGLGISIFNIFIGLDYTKINDDDIVGVVTYQDTLKQKYGLGVVLGKLYTSYSQTTVDSVYKGDPKIKTSSIFLSYSVSKNWNVNGSYTKKVSGYTNDSESGISVGYSF